MLGCLLLIVQYPLVTSHHAGLWYNKRVCMLMYKEATLGTFLYGCLVILMQPETTVYGMYKHSTLWLLLHSILWCYCLIGLYLVFALLATWEKYLFKRSLCHLQLKCASVVKITWQSSGTGSPCHIHKWHTTYVQAWHDTEYTNTRVLSHDCYS